MNVGFIHFVEVVGCALHEGGGYDVLEAVDRYVGATSAVVMPGSEEKPRNVVFAEI